MRFHDGPVVFSPRPKLGDEVTRYLRDSIMSGDHPAGQRILVEELARSLEVSTMPVREALAALANEGLLEALPRRGYRVAVLSRQDIEDVFVVHSYVAGLLAERSATLIDPIALAQLRDMQVQTLQIARRRAAFATRAKQVEEINYRFHRLINRVPDAARLRWFLRAATRYVPRHFYQSIPSWVDATISDHPAIIDALERRDAMDARRLTEEHIARAGQLVVDHLAARGFWSDSPTVKRSGVQVDSSG